MTPPKLFDDYEEWSLFLLFFISDLERTDELGF